MKRYTPIEQVFAAKITAIGLLVDNENRTSEITLEDGTQVYENAEKFQFAKPGDMYVRPVANKFNPLPSGYYLSGICFPSMFRESLPQLADNYVPAERIEAMLETLTVQCQRFPGTTTTIALAALPGGFVVGQGMSACVDPAMFDAQKGVQYATADALSKAREKLWELEGYYLMRLREQGSQQ